MEGNIIRIGLPFLLTVLSHLSMMDGFHRGIAQSGSAPALGAGCRGFKSLCPDFIYTEESALLRSSFF